MHEGRALVHAKRDRVGANGEPVGSSTVDPKEVDETVARTLKKLHDGNVEDINKAIDSVKRGEALRNVIVFSGENA